MLLGQFHIIKDSEENLEEILPPMRLERRAMSFNNVKEYCQCTRPNIQFTSAHHTGQFKQ